MGVQRQIFSVAALTLWNYFLAEVYLGLAVLSFQKALKTVLLGRYLSISGPVGLHFGLSLFLLLVVFSFDDGFIGALRMICFYVMMHLTIISYLESLQYRCSVEVYNN